MTLRNEWALISSRNLKLGWNHFFFFLPRCKRTDKSVKKQSTRVFELPKGFISHTNPFISSAFSPCWLFKGNFYPFSRPLICLCFAYMTVFWLLPQPLWSGESSHDWTYQANHQFLILQTQLGNIGNNLENQTTLRLWLSRDVHWHLHLWPKLTVHQ